MSGYGDVAFSLGFATAFHWRSLFAFPPPTNDGIGRVGHWESFLWKFPHLVTKVLLYRDELCIRPRRESRLRLSCGCLDAVLARVIGKHWNQSRNEVFNQSKLSPLLPRNLFRDRFHLKTLMAPAKRRERFVYYYTLLKRFIIGPK